MRQNLRSHSPFKRLMSLLFAVLMVVSTFSTAFASDSFYISGVIPASSEGYAFIQVTDLEGKLGSGTLTIDEGEFPLLVSQDVLPTTYWFIIDVSTGPVTSKYNLDGIEEAARALTALPVNEKDNVRIVWVADQAEISNTLSMDDVRSLFNIEVATRYNGYMKAKSALYDGLADAIDGALEDPDRFHRIYVVTDGSDVSSLNNLTSRISNTRPLQVNAILLHNTSTSNSTSLFTSGHNLLKGFVASTNGVTYTLDMKPDTVTKVASLAEQANAAVTLFQRHIENSFVLVADLSSGYEFLAHDAEKSLITIASGSTSDSFEVDLNLAAVPAPVTEPTVEPTATPTAEPTPTPTPTPKPEFKALSLGEKDAGTDTFIVDMQMRLKALGFVSSSYVPGEYDDATAKALKDFAAQNNITLSKPDGTAVSVIELRQLFNNSVQRKVTPTPEPTHTPTPTPTATPEFIDLVIGDEDKGDAAYVLNMQNYLARLGFFSSNYTPGMYDEATANALKAFCERAGLNVTNDGAEVSVRTLQILSLSNVTPTPAPTHTPTPTPTPSPTPVPDRIDLEYGMVDDPNYPFVSNMQDRLYDLGYITADTIYTYGSYDDGTVAALIQFCTENNQPLEENGYKASLSLLRYLYGSLARPHVTPSPTPTATPTQAPTPAPDFIDLNLDDVDTGNAKYIMNMQAKLAELGFFSESYTIGTYDNATANALRAFCVCAGFNASTDGTSANANTLRFLSNSRVTPTPVPTEAPTATPTPSPTPLPELIALEYGHMDHGDYVHVFNMQNRLKELGYLTDASVTYGTYDDATAEALRQFCNENQISPVDAGYAAPLSVLRLLMGNAAKAYVPPTPTPLAPYIDLKLNDRDAADTDYIAQMQSRLNALGYYDASFQPGVYEQSTADALLLFCQQGGYDVSSKGEYVTASFLERFLFTQNTPARKVVEPPLSEKLLTALGGTIALFGLSLPLWAVVAACAVLLIVIVVLIIVVMHRGKSHNDTMITSSIQAASAVASNADLSSLHDGMTVAGNDDEMTVADGVSPFASSYGDSGVSAQLEMQYNGHTVLSSRFNITGSLTIGRGRTASGMDCDVKTDPADKSVSRHHCTLLAVDGRLKVRNESSQARGTILNNMPITGNGGASEEAMTVADDSGAGEEYLNSGDVIQIGNHYITITY